MMPTSIPVLIRLHVFYHACEEPHFGELELARRWPTRLQAEPWDALSEGCRNERPYGCDPHSFDARCGISLRGHSEFSIPRGARCWALYQDRDSSTPGHGSSRRGL